VAAKVLEPPGPGVVEEGGQAPACGWAMQVALVCSIPWPSRQIAPHSYQDDPDETTHW